MNERISIAIAPGDRAAEEEETRKAKFAPMMASMVPAGKVRTADNLGRTLRMAFRVPHMTSIL